MLSHINTPESIKLSVLLVRLLPVSLSSGTLLVRSRHMQSNDSSPFLPDCCVTATDTPSRVLLTRAHMGLLYLGGFYTVGLLLLVAPSIQRQ